MIARARSELRRLLRDAGGNALGEFALILPVLLTAGMYGLEMAWLHTTNLQVSQVALSVADNAARMQQTSNSGVSPTVTESDVNAVLTGGRIQSNGLDIAGRGKIILSSLERNSTGNQFFRWQRCTGGYVANSWYGAGGATVTNTGIGAGATKITAPVNQAVMFVEVYYRYRPLFGTMFVQPMIFHQEAAFLMRDDRNLTAGITGTAANAC